jgi:ribosomal protein S18 acetylase RimI-like enzyme
MTAAVEIRQAKDDDCAGILECLRLAFAPYERSYTQGAYLDTVLTRETLNERLRAMCVFVVEDSGKIVGTIACQALNHDEGHLRGMAVHPEWQRTGIAQQLLDRAEAELRKRGRKRVSLDTTEPLRHAVSFYERNGFCPTGRVGDFFGMPLFEYVKEL